MTTVTQQEIENFRSILANDDDAQQALTVIENSKGKLDNAVLVMFNDANVENLMGGGFGRSLRQLANLCSKVICQPIFKEEFIDKFSYTVITIMIVDVKNKLAGTGNLANDSLLTMLAVAVVMYVFKQGREKFCELSNSNS